MKRKLLNNLWNKYQRTMWYVGQTGNEIGKPLRFYSETALLLLLLDKFGIPMTPTQFIIIYAGILIIAAITGKFLAKIGTVKYNTHLSNNHNEELITIMEDVKELKRGMKR